MESREHSSEFLKTLSAFDETAIDSPRTSIRRLSNTALASEMFETFPYRSDPTTVLSFDRQLGQGGMGEVHLAKQRSTGRNVAVKRVRREHRDNAVYKRALLSEGWLMASLEHPNIPPVHDVLVDNEGQPLVMLKEIEGDDWFALMRDDATVTRRFGESLENWNLGVLTKICDAMRYAHSEGIVHRDLKPENIMIGEFGAVYVLDWGIAATLKPDPEQRLPYLGDTERPVGTPCYMAPELLADSVHPVDARTDVYLIGGMLYEALTGRPPHTGTSMRAVAQSIVSSSFEFSDGVPDGLAAICRRAMAADPGERYQSVDELQQALRLYQSRRASELLMQKALRRVDTLKLLADEAVGQDSYLEMVTVFSECRFGFQRAIELSGEDTQAQDFLNEATELMCERALLEGNFDAAATFLAEVEEPSEELVGRVEEARKKNRERLERLARLERIGDAKLGNEKRVAVVALLAIVSIIGTFTRDLIQSSSANVVIITIAWQVGLVFIFTAIYKRFALEETENNRLVFVIILTALVAQLLVSCASLVTGASLAEMDMFFTVVWMTCAVSATITMGWIYVPSLLASIAILIFVALSPAHFFHAVAGGVLVMTLNFVVVYLLKLTPQGLIRERSKS